VPNRGCPYESTARGGSVDEVSIALQMAFQLERIEYR
jgi:hypothetical protein